MEIEVVIFSLQYLWRLILVLEQVRTNNFHELKKGKFCDFI